MHDAIEAARTRAMHGEGTMNRLYSKSTSDVLFAVVTLLAIAGCVAALVRVFS